MWSATANGCSSTCTLSYESLPPLLIDETSLSDARRTEELEEVLKRHNVFESEEESKCRTAVLK